MSEREEMEDGVSENRSSLHQATDCYIKNREFHFHDPSSLLRPSFMQAPVRVPASSKPHSKAAVGAQRVAKPIPLKANHAVLPAKGKQGSSTSKPPNSARRQEPQNTRTGRSESSATKKELERAETAKLRASRDKRKLERAQLQTEQSPASAKVTRQAATREEPRAANQLTKSRSTGSLAARRPRSQAAVAVIDHHDDPSGQNGAYNGLRRSGQIHER